MAFMMPVMKNDWDIYNSQRSRRASESTEKVVGRVRKVSESRSEGPAMSPRSGVLAAHRSAPAMRSLSYSRAPAPSSRVSLRNAQDSPSKGSASPPNSKSRDSDKFHSRLVEKLRRALGRSDSRTDERTS